MKLTFDEETVLRYLELRNRAPIADQRSDMFNARVGLKGLITFNILTASGRAALAELKERG